MQFLEENIYGLTDMSLIDFLRAQLTIEELWIKQWFSTMPYDITMAEWIDNGVFLHLYL